MATDPSEYIGYVRIHPAAHFFPEMEGDEFWALVEDIKKNGCHEPVAFLNDLLLDGRNRVKACQSAGAKYRRTNLPDDTDPYHYVWSCNAERRHLTAAQKAEIRLRVMKESGE